MGAMQPWHWLIVAVVFMMLFGAKRLPDLARSVGQSARVFKGEIRGLEADDEARATAELPSPAASSVPSSVPLSAGVRPEPR